MFNYQGTTYGYYPEESSLCQKQLKTLYPVKVTCPKYRTLIMDDLMDVASLMLLFIQGHRHALGRGASKCARFVFFWYKSN